MQGNGKYTSAYFYSIVVVGKTQFAGGKLNSEKSIRSRRLLYWIFLLILGSVMKMKEHTTVCIIGGADGPTSIFLAGNLGDNLSISFILTGIAVLIIIVICYLKRKH